MKSTLAAIAMALVTACAAGTSSTSGGSQGAGGDGSGGSGGAGGGPGARGDALPRSTIGFFQVPACPSGWEPYKAAAGRTLLPTIGDAAGGTTVGEPLVSGEERAHSHRVNATFDLVPISYAGVSGGGNAGVAAAGTAVFETTSEEATTGLPYVQLLACKKLAEPVAGGKPLPRGMQIFYDGPTCPSGFQQAAATQGRLVVGLPKGAPADLSFGGEPLSSAAPRAHTHGGDTSLATASHGIGLVSNGAATGYARNDTYTSATQTDASEAALPFLELIHCEKL
ncbi:hypothetical protein [Polyangium spumosum]|uniref:Phage tail collar domain-containing protein n=1 Tax=Polyangium spumosum TaxID=889282 RepID=A0A6N7Q1P4_9BACT|nr:hypothetical protein [Polyangium spumosum]MRG96730.1 hypothetical protein [Polyangium spumosum]